MQRRLSHEVNAMAGRTSTGRKYDLFKRSSPRVQPGAWIAALLLLLMTAAMQRESRAQMSVESSARHEAFLRHWGEGECSLATLDADVRAREVASAQFSGEPQMKNVNVIEMTRRGDAEEVILSVIHGFPGPFDLSSAGRAALKKAGVSNKVLAEMQQLAAERATKARLVSFLTLRSVAEAMCRAEKQGKRTLQGTAAAGAEKRRYAAVYRQLVDLQTARESYLDALGAYLSANSMWSRGAMKVRFLREQALRTQVFLLQSHLLGLARSLRSLKVNLDVRAVDSNSASDVRKGRPGKQPATEEGVGTWMAEWPLPRWQLRDFGSLAAYNGRALEKSINAFKDLLEAKDPGLVGEARLHLKEVEMESDRSQPSRALRAAL